MRKAAAILLIILGTITGSSVAFVDVLLGWGDGSMDYACFIAFAIIPAVFVIPGGVFCLKRRYWKLCFTSSLLLLFIGLYLFIAFNFYYRPTIPVDTDLVMTPYTGRFLISFLIWFVIVGGILPIIFVCLRKREWLQSQT